MDFTESSGPVQGGFTVFQPLELQTFQRKGRFQPIPDPENRFSTGSLDLDKLLGGGYSQGGIILFETGDNISNFNWQLIICPTLANFISHGRAGIILPASGINTDIVVAKMKEMYGFTDEELSKLLRILEISPLGEIRKNVCSVTIQGEDVMEDYATWLKTEDELKEKTGNPVVEYVAHDMIEATYGTEAFKQIINSVTTKTRNEGNLTIGIASPGFEHLTRRAANISDIHLKLLREHGTLLLYGKKPRTNLHAVDLDPSKEYPLPKLTPLI